MEQRPLAELPFRLVGGGNPLMLIDVRVNGTGPYEFILDTGASTCLITPDLARGLGVPTTGSRRALGAGGSVEVLLGQVQTLELGDLRVNDLPVGITDDLQRIGRAIGANVDGNIGYNLLKDSRISIDYRAGRLRLDPSPALPGPTTGIPFQLNVKKPLILLPGSVNGRGPFQFALDTGASAMALSRQAADTAGLQAGAGAIGGTGGGGSVAYATARADSITVGGDSLHGVDVMVVDFLEALGRAVESRIDGIVGYSFLREFRVIIDYPNRWLRLDRIQ